MTVQVHIENVFPIPIYHSDIDVSNIDLSGLEYRSGGTENSVMLSVDEFILLDDMQYTRRDWRNRNQIKTPQGVQWITVPVKVRGKYHQKIRETQIEGIDWAVAHWKALAQNYRRAPYFAEIALWLRPLYLSENFTHISQLNRRLIEAICIYLGIKTTITNSWDYTMPNGKTERLAGL